MSVINKMSKKEALTALVKVAKLQQKLLQKLASNEVSYPDWGVLDQHDSEADFGLHHMLESSTPYPWSHETMEGHPNTAHLKMKHEGKEYKLEIMYLDRVPCKNGEEFKAYVVGALRSNPGDRPVELYDIVVFDDNNHPLPDSKAADIVEQVPSSAFSMGLADLKRNDPRYVKVEKF